MHSGANFVADLSARVIRLEPDNLVSRPWGGEWIERHKRLVRDNLSASPPFGEAFEISAFDEDTEARQFPSRVRLDDDTVAELPELLRSHGRDLLGAAFVDRHGASFPLLPKTLSVKELLSVQGHPSGHTEVYIIIDAEPGATLRLGFRRDIDADLMKRHLTQGIAQQGELARLLRADLDPLVLHRLLAPWLATRDQGEASVVPMLSSWLADGHSQGRAISIIRSLKDLYWLVLDSMNVIEALPGQVIYNATPERLIAERGGIPSAEVHALGNTEGREILALEVRRPGPTFRAWDNVRFPQREVDVIAAIDALNLRATDPDEFLVDPTPVQGRPGASVSVDCEYFRVEHLSPDLRRVVEVPASGPHSLHCLAGTVEIENSARRIVGMLGTGDSALVPVGVGAYRVCSKEPAEVVRLSLPDTE